MGKPLIEIFNENSYDIYRKFSLREAGVIQEPLIEVKPDDPNLESPPSDELYLRGGQTAKRHERRMANYQELERGKLFVDKQKRLQKQNTFSQTRELDPDFITKHSVSGTSQPRHKVASVGDFLSGTFASKFSTAGHLQLDTQDGTRSLVRKRLMSDRGSLLLRNDGPGGFEIAGLNIGGFIQSAIDRAGGWARDRVRGLNPFPDILEKKFGISGGISRPEHKFDVAGRSYFEYLSKKYEHDHGFKWNLDRMVNVNYGADGLGPSMSIGRSVKSGNLTAYTSRDNRTSYRDFIEFLKNNYEVSADPRAPKIVRRHGDTRKKVRYFKDLTQVMEDGIIDQESIQKEYRTDTVDLIFSSIVEKPSGDEDDQPLNVRFRALIEDLKETVTPSYTEKNYVGRIEKFYVYDTVVRDLKMVFNLHAFSELELQHIWSKVNHLTSLAYPQTVRGGYPTPNIFKITVGKVYVKQSAILKGVTHTLIDNSTSWDIHEQLPMTVQVTMNIRLIDDALYTHGAVAHRSRKGTSDRSPASNIYQESATQQELQEYLKLGLQALTGRTP